MKEPPTSQTNAIGDDQGRTETEATARLLRSLVTNPFWTIVVLTGIAFVVTCLATIAATMGDPQGPMNRLITNYGTAAIGGEAATLILSGLLAMTLDRLQTLRRGRMQAESDTDVQHLPARSSSVD